MSDATTLAPTIRPGYVPSDRDGQPFGLPADQYRDCYYLLMAPNGNVRLVRVDESGSPQVAGADRFIWPTMAPIVLEDWNARLVAKGAAPGSFPQPGGRTYLHKAFGREMEIAMAAADLPQEIRNHMKFWKMGTPADRLTVWKVVQPVGYFAYGVTPANYVLQTMIREMKLLAVTSNMASAPPRRVEPRQEAA